MSQGTQEEKEVQVWSGDAVENMGLLSNFFDRYKWSRPHSTYSSDACPPCVSASYVTLSLCASLSVNLGRWDSGV